MSSEIVSSKEQTCPLEISKRPIVEWRWGRSGTGKTEGVYKKHGYHNVYSKDGTRFWDGYEQEDAILIDDFDGHTFPKGQDLLKLLNSMSYMGQCKKRGFSQINSQFIYITCLYPPDHFWSGDELDYIKTRLASIVELKHVDMADALKEQSVSQKEQSLSPVKALVEEVKMKLILKKTLPIVQKIILPETKLQSKLSFHNQVKASILEEYQDVVWKPWQQKVFDIINGEPDQSAIDWFWEPTGNTGKTYLAKFIGLTYKECVLSNGSQSVLFGQVRGRIKSGIMPKCVIIDLARSEKMNYSALNEIKDGRCGMGYMFERPHVIVFASCKPNMKMISAGKWNIVHI
jgi:hypothetical protein